MKKGIPIGKHHRVSGPVTSVARVEDVQIFLKDPVYRHIAHISLVKYVKFDVCVTVQH